MSGIFTGIDLGGTNTKIGCFDEDLNLIAKTSILTKVEKGAESVIDRIGVATEKMLVEHGHNAADIVAAGIGSPGVVDSKAGVVLVTSNLGFQNTPLRDMLSDRLDRPVVLENDANVTAWGERVAGAGKGADEMVLIALGTGIGSGVIANGELVHGFGNNAAELGHIVLYPNGRLCGCGQRGCVEAYASASSTAARATEALKAGRPSSLQKVLQEKGEITCKDVYEHLAANDELARNITDGTAKALALLCVCILHYSGPVRVVFFGAMTGAGDLLLGPIKKHFNEQIWNLKPEEMQICLAILGNEAGIIGTAGLALHKWKKGQLA